MRRVLMFAALGPAVIVGVSRLARPRVIEIAKVARDGGAIRLLEHDGLAAAAPVAIGVAVLVMSVLLALYLRRRRVRQAYKIDLAEVESSELHSRWGAAIRPVDFDALAQRQQWRLRDEGRLENWHPAARSFERRER